MNKPTKKIIAREFLIILCSSVFVFLTVMIWSLLIERKQNQIYDLETQLIGYRKEFAKEKKGSFPVILDLYVFLYNDNHRNHFYLDDPKEFTSEIQDNVKSNKYFDYLTYNGYIDIDFKRFRNGIEGDTVSKSWMKKIIPITDKLRDYKRSSFSSSLDNDSIYKLILIVSIFIFGFRYLFYAIVWSVKELKN